MEAIEFGSSPLPVHIPFFRSDALERALFGAFGSGKTYALCDEAIAQCLEQPGIRGMLTRRTVPELRDTTETVFFDRLPDELYRAGTERRTGGHVESFLFPNGSRVLFRSIDDWKKHKSLNVGFIGWDEADEFDEETYLGMKSRVRQRDPTPEAARMGYGSIERRCMFLATNPNGHDWLYRRFVDQNTRAKGTEFFKSTSFDNPFLPPEYIDALLEYPEQWVRRYVLCQFDDFAGQIYEDWGWDTHVVDPYDLTKGAAAYPGGAMFWMGMDPGTRNPTAGLWVVVDPNKREMVGVAEYEENSLAAPKHAAEWRRIEAKNRLRVNWRIADPSIMTRDRGTNMELHTQYARLGFNFQLGPRLHKDRIPMLGNLIHTKRFKVTKNCPHTYEAIKNYRWEELSAQMRAKGIDAPEKPLKSGDHPVDCAQYLASRWVRPIGRVIPKAPESFSEEAHQIIRKQQKRRRIAQPQPQDHDLGSLIV